MNDVTHSCLYFPMVAIWINKEGMSPWFGYQLFQVAWLCFDVAVPYFEEILLDLQEHNQKKPKDYRM